MKYLLTIYGDESRFEDLTPDDMRFTLQAYTAFGEEGTRAGVIRGGEGLQPTATAVSTVTIGVALAKSPKAMPEFWTWWIESGPATWRASSSARLLETMCFVSWSAASAANAIASRPLHCCTRAASER